VRLLNIHGANDVRLDPRDPPQAGDRDVVIAVKACGICGSDLSYIKLGGVRRGDKTPLGHEAAGEVLCVGPAVEGVSVGDRVAINPMNTPSFIGSGGPEGAFTEALLLQEARLGVNLLPIADDLPYEVAALTEPLAVALHAVHRAEVAPGDRVVVFGCGPIGLGIVLWLVDRGVTDVVALDLVPERRERALALGARAVIDPTREDVRARLEALHGKVLRTVGSGVGTDAFIDAAGAPTILNDVIAMAKQHARLVVTAAYMQPTRVHLGGLLYSEMTITASVGYPTEMPEVVASLPRIRDKAASMISHRMPFEQMLAALEVAADPRSAKVMIHF